MHNTDPYFAKKAKEEGKPDVPHYWLSTDLWRFRLISPACAAVGKSVWVKLSLDSKDWTTHFRRQTYTDLHLPPRCGDLHNLRRVICDGGLGQIVKRVVYHTQPVYKEEKLEENLRRVLNEESPITQRFPNNKMARYGADLMIRQQQEQADFFRQLSSDGGRQDFQAILCGLESDVELRVRTPDGLYKFWLIEQPCIVDSLLPRGDHPDATQSAALAIALMRPKKVHLNCISSTFFAVDMNLSPEFASLSGRAVPLSLESSLMRITDLELSKIRLVGVERICGPSIARDSADVKKVINGFHTFLESLCNLRRLRISFNWEVELASASSGIYHYADMLLNGMLKNQRWHHLESLTIEGTVASADELVKCITKQPTLEKFSSMSLRLTDEREALKILQCMSEKRRISWWLSHLNIILDDERPFTEGEIQSLIQDINGRKHGHVTINDWR